ncbi:MAG: transposase, partial [Acidobacteriota bacterium]|nr:transposase [Acidobacteriota bacterium]
LQVQAMGDPRQAAPPRKEAAQQRAKREREQKLEAALEQLEQVRRERSGTNREEARASETDPEARIMKRSGGGFEPSYNVQISTDAAAGIVVGVHVTQSGGDSPHLIPAVETIQANLNRMPGQILADAGYMGPPTSSLCMARPI